MNRLATSIGLLVAVACSSVELAGQSTAGTASPPLPKYQSPVEFFRELLSATPAERDELLKERREAHRAVILAKIEEYTILPPPVREWRLKATELRYYLIPLMKRPPDQRGRLVDMIPETDRPLVQSRLRQWDALPEAERDAMLESQIALRYLARPANVAPRPPGATPDPKLQQLETTAANWQSLSKADQDSIAQQFNSFFALSRLEKQKTIALFTGAERAQLQQTVRSFEGMSDQDRNKCLVAMKEIVQMSATERAAFLRNVERWNALSEGDRHQWRALVAKVPPLPPGFPPAVSR